MKPRIAIIGRGNVAVHLAQAFADSAEIRIINPHQPEFIDYTPDICLLSVSDSAIAEVAAKVAHLDCIVAHTSGTTAIDILREAGVRRPGVFYPLQTFSKGIKLDYSEIPVFIEGDTPDIEWILKGIAALFSKKVTVADSDTRKHLHLASVFACNFVNHLWNIADETLRLNNLSLNVLHPLMKETLRKAVECGPENSQTGPAKRNDQLTVIRHLDMLNQSPEKAAIYKMLSESITKHYLNDECNRL